MQQDRVDRRTRLRRYLSSGSKRVYGLVATSAVPLILAIDAAQKNLNVRGHMGEIGVFYGKLLILLHLLRRDDEQTVAVDIFTLGNFKQKFIRNVESHAGEIDKLHILHEDSGKLSSQDIVDVVGGQIRLFSLDGDHTVQSVEHDLSLARDSLSDGGVILLDDYFNEEWPGVSEATNRFFLHDQNHGIVPFAIGGNKVYFSHEKFSEPYRQALLQEGFDASLTEREMFGVPVLSYNFTPHNFFGFNVSQKWVNTPAWRQLKQTALGDFIRFRLRKL